MTQYTVQAPDGSTITLEGPEGASQAEVIAKAQELYQTRSQQAAQPARQQPTSFLEYLRTQPLLEPFTRQAIRGAAVDPINAVRQLVSEEQRKQVAKEEAAYQAERQQLGETGTEYGRFVGGVLSPASLLAGAGAMRAVGGTGVIAGIRQAAGAGAAGAALQPVLDQEVDFAEEKIKQLGFGVVTGGLLEGGIRGVTGGVNFIRNFVKPMSEEGRRTLLRDFLNKLSGPEREQVLTSLRNAEELVPGARPTAAEAIAEVPSATGLGAFQRQLEIDQAAGTAPLFAAREAQQEAARMTALGGDGTAIPMTEALRAARTAPLREEALSQANIAGLTTGPQLEAQLASREASMVNALQQQGQLQSLAAQQGQIAQRPFAPMAEAGVPAISGRYSVAATTAADAIDAAKFTGDIVAQRKAEVAFKKLQVQSLADEGFFPLKIDPVINKIDDILRTPGERSEVAEKSLASLRQKLIEKSNQNNVIDSRDLYTVRKEIANDIAKFAEDTKTSDLRRLASLETTLRKTIDNSIEKAGGVAWKDYLTNYADYSQKINRMQIGEELAKKLRTTLGDTERAGAFANAVDNAALTIKRATGAPRYDTLREILSESEMKAINAVTADLQRSAKAGRLMGKARISGMEAGETPELPQLLSRTAALGNFLLKAVKKNAVDDINRQAAELFLDPQKLAIFMQQPNSARAITALFKKLSPKTRDYLQRVVAVQTVNEPMPEEQ